MAEVAWVTASLAGLTTLTLLILATPLAWWLARGRSWTRDAVAALAAAPLVLPPTVLGFYLLVALGPRSPLMALLHPFGVRTLAFTFWGLLIGSVIYSLPFAVQPLKTAFEAVGERTLESAMVLGASRLDRFLKVGLPLSRRGYVAAAILVFAHTVGEFGVVLMIGGAIPGKTETLSIRIFELVEALDFAHAHVIAGGLATFAVLAMLAMLLIERRIAPPPP